MNRKKTKKERKKPKKKTKRYLNGQCPTHISGLGMYDITTTIT